VARRHTAFTLIELLVVMAIIGILIALLFPAINEALTIANELKCKNNLAQLAKVVQAYCSDFQGSFPLFSTGTSMPSANNWLYTPDRLGKPDYRQGLLMKHRYIGKEDILYCPVDLEHGRIRPSGALTKRLTTGEDVGPTSYVINASITWGEHQWSSDRRTGVRSRNHVDFNPNDFLFIEESSGVEPEPKSDFDQGYMTPNTAKYALTNRHRGGGFVSCMDGHVVWFTTEQFGDAMRRVGASGDWYYRTFTRPSSQPAGVVTDEETATRWNPG